MASEQQQILEQQIDKVVAYIPVVWPLQQFIATNPLWDLTAKPMDLVLKALCATTSVSVGLSLHEYREYYHAGKITEQALQQSISIFFQQMGVDHSPEAQQQLYEKLLHNHQLEKLMQERAVPSDLLLSAQLQLQPGVYDTPLDRVQTQCLDWLADYFNPEKPMIDQRPNNLFAYWYQAMRVKNKAWRSVLSGYPSDKFLLVDALLTALQVPESARSNYLMAICWRLKGWVGYIKWQKNYPTVPGYHQSADVIDVIAMWLAYEAVYWAAYQNHNQSSNFVPDYQDRQEANCNDYVDLILLWQRAYELSYAQQLHMQLEKKAQAAQRLAEPQKSSDPMSQWVFCIDVRSEGFRRHLEQVGNHETFGFAGFFGFAYQLRDNETGRCANQCPALITPDLLLERRRVSSSIVRQVAAAISSSVKYGKRSIFSPFVLYEMFGFWASVVLVAKNYLTRLSAWIRSCLGAPTLTVDSLSVSIEEIAQVNTLADSAKGLLASMGLTDHFAPIVVLCGHYAVTENNPYQSALDCGACGGNTGVSNAIVAAEVLNNPQVRARLEELGIRIPDTTRFIAACHNTTTDQIVWYVNTKSLTKAERTYLQQIKQDAVYAGEQLQVERVRDLPGDTSSIRRSRHWAELMPEWGLANNEAMIIGPRELTSGLDLERRVFLHSYDSAQDPDGSLLAGIFLGPVVVAHWINSQYYFSAVDPRHYGSGNKAIHNVLPYVGVMEGNQSDLKYGLPYQSLFFRDQRMHEPLRLLVLVDAEEDKIANMLQQHDSLQALVTGQWITVKSLRAA